MPGQVVRQFPDAEELRAACKVSPPAAEIAFDQHVARFRKRDRPQCVRDYLAEFMPKQNNPIVHMKFGNLPECRA
jgi:hypothetical protein